MTCFQAALATQTGAGAENLKAEIHESMFAGQLRAYRFIALEDLTLDAFLAGVERAS